MISNKVSFNSLLSALGFPFSSSLACFSCSLIVGGEVFIDGESGGWPNLHPNDHGEDKESQKAWEEHDQGREETITFSLTSLLWIVVPLFPLICFFDSFFFSNIYVLLIKSSQKAPLMKMPKKNLRFVFSFLFKFSFFPTFSILQFVFIKKSVQILEDIKGFENCTKTVAILEITICPL